MTSPYGAPAREPLPAAFGQPLRRVAAANNPANPIATNVAALASGTTKPAEFKRSAIGGSDCVEKLPEASCTDKPSNAELPGEANTSGIPSS